MAASDVNRKLTAILCADVVGYSRLMGADEAATVAAITASREVFVNQIERHKGRVVDAKGDAILAEFASVVDAVNAAVAVQARLGERNAELPEERRMHFRIGINLGDVIVQDEAIYGDGVNIAARLEALAEPGGVCISRQVHDQVKGKLKLEYEDLGEQKVKNIAEPVWAYKVCTEPLGAAQLAPPPSQGAAGETPALALPDEPSIAVLPFANMSNDPEQEFFGDGLAEDIITDLSRISGLFVIARNSSFSYKGRNVPVGQIGQEMGVRYVLEGSMRKEGARVRITAQLVETGTGRHLWAKRFDRNLEDVFAVQDEITEEVVTALDVKLIAGEQARLWRKSLKNPEARELYYRARESYHHLSKEGQFQARQLFAQVVTAEPDSPLGFAYQAFTHWYDAFRGWSEDPAKSLARAEELVQSALARDESNPDAHTVLAAIYSQKREYEQAILEAERAIALGPNMADNLVIVGMVFYFSGRLEEAHALTRRAVRLCPVCPGHFLALLGQTLNLLGRYEDAIEPYQKAAAQEPDYPTPHFGLAVAYGALGRKKEAHAAAETFRSLAPHVASLQEYARRHPFREPAVINGWLEALRKAGIPE